MTVYLINIQIDLHNGDVSLRIINTRQVSMHKFKNFKDTIAHTAQHPVRRMLINITSPNRQLPKALYSLRYEVRILMHFWLCLHNKNLFKKYQQNVYNFTDPSEFSYTGKEIINEENGLCSHTNIPYSSGHRIVWIYTTRFGTAAGAAVCNTHTLNILSYVPPSFITIHVFFTIHCFTHFIMFCFLNIYVRGMRPIPILHKDDCMIFL
jgi:hypothetical protein